MKSKRKSKRKAIIAIIAVLLVVILIGGKLFMDYTQKNLDKLNALSITDVDLSKAADGEYTGSYSVFPVSVKVLVTVKDHRIDKIDIIEHQNGKGKAAEILPQKVIEAQSLSVDTISGASYSSKVILKSIENALTQSVQ